MKYAIYHTFKFRILGLITTSLLVSCGQDSSNNDNVDSSTTISGTVTLPGGGGDIGSTSDLSTLDRKAHQNPFYSSNSQESAVIPGEYLITLDPSIHAQNIQTLQIAGQTLERDIGIPSLGIWSYRTKRVFPCNHPVLF